MFRACDFFVKQYNDRGQRQAGYGIHNDGGEE